MSDSENGNVSLMIKPDSSSTEDLSEYTDADESISSAPTEFLAEFLSAVMLKDYPTAFKYCKLILQYEPNNVTAKEFYPLIIAKLHQEVNSSGSNDSDEDEDIDINDNEDSSSSDSGKSESTGSESDSEGKEEGEGSNGDRNSDATTASYSSLEDDEPDLNQLAKLTARLHVDNVDIGNGNIKIGSTANTPAAKRAWEIADDNKTDNVSIGHIAFTLQTSSDSESPTEPISQQLIAQLRARVTNVNH